MRIESNNEGSGSVRFGHCCSSGFPPLLNARGDNARTCVDILSTFTFIFVATSSVCCLRRRSATLHRRLSSVARYNNSWWSVWEWSVTIQSQYLMVPEKLQLQYQLVGSFVTLTGSILWKRLEISYQIQNCCISATVRWFPRNLARLTTQTGVQQIKFSRNNISKFCWVRRAEIHRHAKFFFKIGQRWRDIVIFQLFKMATVCYLRLVWCI